MKNKISMAATGRMTAKDVTPEARLAAVARTIQLYYEPNSRVPDYSDYVEAMRVYVHKELILVRIDEARKCGGLMLTARITELAIELAECEKQIPAEARFGNAR